MPQQPLAGFDQRVTLLVPTLTGDGQGGQERVLAPGATVWARVERLRGGEEGVAGVEGRYRITFRARFALAQQAHLQWQGQVLRVVAIRDDGGRYAGMSVEAVIAGG